MRKSHPLQLETQDPQCHPSWVSQSFSHLAVRICSRRVANRPCYLPVVQTQKLCSPLKPPKFIGVLSWKQDLGAPCPSSRDAQRSAASDPGLFQPLRSRGAPKTSHHTPRSEPPATCLSKRNGSTRSSGGQWSLSWTHSGMSNQDRSAFGKAG